MLIVSVGSFVLFVVVIYLVAAPALRQDPIEDPATVSGLATRKEQLLSDIRELDMDLATGKLDEEDHRRLRAATLVVAVDTLKALEEVEPPPAPSGAVDDSERRDADDARLEALIAARKRELEASTCPTCAAISDPTDAFCRRCGAELSTRQVG
jgi:ribosomal protein L40E